MSARSKIVNAMVDKIKTIDGATPFSSALYENVHNRQKFWDEVNDYPFVCLNAGSETREYQADTFKWGFLLVSVKIYTKDDEPQEELERIMEDIEYVMEDQHTRLIYDEVTGAKTADIRLLQIVTDEGVLDPIAVGEMTFHIRYEV